LTSLLDVNVLLALAWEPHEHHEAAHRWFQNAAADGWATCLLTQTAFLRLSMNPHIVHVDLNCQAARTLLTDVVAHPHHRFIADCPSLTAASFDQLVLRISGYRQMTDATLLLLAQSHSLRLVTFDRSMASLSPWPDTVEVLDAGA
jgi:toxin-antitoxin system PIN domain toxin